MSLKKYLIFIKILITVYPYFAIRTLFKTYYTNKIDYYFYIYCILFGATLGLIVCVITELIEYYPFFEPFTLSSGETHILNDDINKIVEQNLKNQEEIKNVKKNTCVWLVVTTVIYSILIFIAINN